MNILYAVHTTTPMQQGRFLSMMGLRTRIAAIRAKAPPERQEIIEEAALRLVDMNSEIGMGSLFKVMAISSETKDIYPWTHTGISV
jgi:SAM-dependent MidA family methyltransferase